MAESFFRQPTESVHSPYAVACAAAEALGDQWRALPGPGLVTGHLHSGDRVPFTVGVCEAGDFYIRNDSVGDSRHLLVDPTADLPSLGAAVARVVGHIY
ncbi:hypothetical protein [Streptomyces mirabilis]